MSALPPKADIRQCKWHVRFVPIADIGRRQPKSRRINRHSTCVISEPVTKQKSVALRRMLQLLHDLVEIETLRLLSRRIILERADEFRGESLESVCQISLVKRPREVGVRRDLRALIGIHAQIKEQRQAPTRKRLAPDIESAGGLLFEENQLPVSNTHCDELAIVVEVDEAFTLGMLLLPGQVGELIVTIEVHLVGSIANLPAVQQPILHAGIAGDREKRREPVVAGKDLV